MAHTHHTQRISLFYLSITSVHSMLATQRNRMFVSSRHNQTILQEDINTLQRSKSDNSCHLGADVLARVDSYPYLGVTISSDLKWHNHILHITAKAPRRTFGFVRRSVYNCPPEVKSLVYTPLIRPQLEYVSAAWDPYLVGDIQQLEEVQRRPARFVFRDYKYTTSVTGLLERLQWPLLSTRCTNSRLTLFYKALHDQAGISLHHLQKPLRNTRSADDTTFISLSARKNPYLFSFFPRTITDWNRLSREQCLKPSVNSFH